MGPTSDKDAPNSAIYGGPEIAAQQHAAYPGIRPFVIRSVSRVGRSDVGTNTRRIRTFLKKFAEASKTGGATRRHPPPLASREHGNGRIVGGVYESYLDCNESSYHSCRDFYPEISFTIGF